jgi:uncharacterized protein (DUF58 family)
MSIYPTRTAAHVAVVGLALLVLGIVLGQAVIVAWGGTMLVALGLARMVTLVSVMRIRAAGFEMLWVGSERVARVHCGHGLELEAEMRNRDTRAARYDRLRVIASPGIEAEVDPCAGEVPASGSVRVRVRVQARRVGHHGVHGLALEVRGAPGLFEVPLTFANPFGVAVQPRALGRALALPQGGRSGTLAAAGRSGRARGDGTELRELREHQPGDPFRRIAWKASARRGMLVVREFEREERDLVLLVLDASVELWSGPMGRAPLDHAIDVVATLAVRHLGNGDPVGLHVVGGRELVRLPAETGRDQAMRIAAALMEHTGVLDADRCGWDEADLLLQVAEHLRPLDPRAAADLRHGDVDRLMQRASTVRAHAPFQRLQPYGRSARDRRLRRYVASFGLHVPARLQPDHPRAVLALCDAVTKAARSASPRPSVVHVVAPGPDESELDAVRAAVRQLRAHRIAVRWTVPSLGATLDDSDDPARASDSVGPAVEQAVLTRAIAAQRRAEAALRRLGVKLVRVGAARPRRELAGALRTARVPWWRAMWPTAPPPSGERDPADEAVA